MGVVRDDPVFGPIDERAHYAYVQFVAEEGRLPLLRDHNRPEVAAVSMGLYPELPARRPEQRGLWGKVYEAFQPPLYYLLGAAVTRGVADHRAQVTLLRVTGVATLFALAGLLAWLSTAVFPEERVIALAFLLNVVLFPGIVVRSVHVGNAGLEIVLTTSFVLLAFLGLERRRPGLLHAAGVALGASLLTRLTSVSFAPLFALVLVVAARRRILDAMGVFLALAIPLLLVSPWVVFNLIHYGAPTANRMARGMQMHIINPERTDFGLVEAVSDFLRQSLTQDQLVMPQEWVLAPGTAVGTLTMVMTVVLFGLPLVGWPFLRARDVPRAWLFALPLPLSVFVWVAAYVIADWPLVARYLYPALPPAMVLAYMALRRVAPRAVGVGASTLIFALLVALWLSRPLPS